MDRTRFEHLLDAYGADFKRWPADERGSAAIFVSQHKEDAAAMLAHARALDAALDAASSVEPSAELARRVLAAAPEPRVFDGRAMLALAACAVFGLVLGYGGGLFAPAPQVSDADFITALEPPFSGWEEEG